MTGVCVPSWLRSADVEIEPDSQTRLLDRTLTAPGVLLAGVPGGASYYLLTCRADSALPCDSRRQRCHLRDCIVVRLLRSRRAAVGATHCWLWQVFLANCSLELSALSGVIVKRLQLDVDRHKRGIDVSLTSLSDVSKLQAVAKSARIASRL